MCVCERGDIFCDVGHGVIVHDAHTTKRERQTKEIKKGQKINRQLPT